MAGGRDTAVLAGHELIAHGDFDCDWHHNADPEDKSAYRREAEQFGSARQIAGGELKLCRRAGCDGRSYRRAECDGSRRDTAVLAGHELIARPAACRRFRLRLAPQQCKPKGKSAYRREGKRFGSARQAAEGELHLYSWAGRVGSGQSRNRIRRPWEVMIAKPTRQPNRSRTTTQCERTGVLGGARQSARSELQALRGIPQAGCAWGGRGIAGG